jgi:hypothetical protein
MQFGRTETRSRRTYFNQKCTIQVPRASTALATPALAGGAREIVHSAQRGVFIFLKNKTLNNMHAAPKMNSHVYPTH